MLIRAEVADVVRSSGLAIASGALDVEPGHAADDAVGRSRDFLDAVGHSFDGVLGNIPVGTDFFAGFFIDFQPGLVVHRATDLFQHIVEIQQGHAGVLVRALAQHLPNPSL